MADIFFSDGKLWFRGDLEVLDASAYKEFDSLESLVLEMGELDVPDGAALSQFVRWIKDQLASGRTLQLIEPPQLLVHNLYRVNCYPHAGLQVVDMRQEEAYG